MHLDEFVCDANDVDDQTHQRGDSCNIEDRVVKAVRDTKSDRELTKDVSQTPALRILHQYWLGVSTALLWRISLTNLSSLPFMEFGLRILFHLLHLSEFSPVPDLRILLIGVVGAVSDVLKSGQLTPPGHRKERAENEKEVKEEEKEEGEGGVRFVCHPELS